jgi:hypothetical protein
MLHRIREVHREACIDCNGVSRRFRRMCLEAVGALTGQRWAVRLAAERGQVSALRELLDGEADLKAELKDDSEALPRCAGTALHCAAYQGHAEAVRLLLGAGADPAVLACTGSPSRPRRDRPAVEGRGRHGAPPTSAAD